MMQVTVEVTNKLGLHARAAARLVRLASRFKSEIHLSIEGESRTIDSKSILGILMLAASKGTRLVVSVCGKDEEEASCAIQQLFRERFGEAE